MRCRSPLRIQKSCWKISSRCVRVGFLHCIVTLEKRYRSIQQQVELNIYQVRNDAGNRLYRVKVNSTAILLKETRYGVREFGVCPVKITCCCFIKNKLDKTRMFCAHFCCIELNRTGKKTTKLELLLKRAGKQRQVANAIIFDYKNPKRKKNQP